MNYRIEPGTAEINDIKLVIDHEDVKVFEIDTKTKYCSIEGYGGVIESDRTETSVYIGDPASCGGETEVIFEGDWVASAAAGRYTICICLYKRKMSDNAY